MHYKRWSMRTQAQKKGKTVPKATKNKKKRSLFTEAELLNGLNAHTAHSDELASVSSKELGE